MNKIASLVKEAEVRGVLAGLVDGGHLKIASAEDLEALTEVVSGAVEGFDYDLNTILSKTAEVLDYLENAEMDKEASDEEVDETAVMAAFGELSMMKMAGEIDDEDFETAIAELGFQVKEAGSMADLLTGKGAKPAGKTVSEFENVLRTREAGLGDFKAPKGAGNPVIRSLTKKEAPKSVGHTPAASGKGPKAKVVSTPNDLGRKAESKGRDIANALSELKRKGSNFALMNPGKVKALKGAGAVGALAAAGLGGKALYDKYKK